MSFIKYIDIGMNVVLQLGEKPPNLVKEWGENLAKLINKKLFNLDRKLKKKTKKFL